ncbi:MAG: tetratricopeptide repeat protein [Bacteroidetes bacterium]|jgi:TolA-binding protein|nr:tetratricopeptide repeat protein [Bacteroidota bacterium]
MKHLLHGASYLVGGLLFVTGLFLSGCGTSVQTAQDHGAADSATVSSLQSRTDRLQSENSQLRTTVSQLEQDKRALNAKVADLTSKLGQSSQQWQDLEDLQSRVNSLDSELTIQRQINRDLSAKNADMERQMITGGAGTVTTSAEFERQYNEGLRSFRARNYKSAISVFNGLAASRVNTPLMSNTHYWLGECYYALQRYNDAIHEFQKTLSYPKSYKEGAAYVMLGMSYLRLGNKESARDTWNRLIARDPKSQFAARAREYLKQL